MLLLLFICNTPFLCALLFDCCSRFENPAVVVRIIFSSTLKSDDCFSRLMKKLIWWLARGWAIRPLFAVLVFSIMHRRITCPLPLQGSEPKPRRPWSQFSGLMIQPCIPRAHSDKNLVTICDVRYYLFWSSYAPDWRGQERANRAERNLCVIIFFIRSSRSLGMATWEGKLSVYHANRRGWQCFTSLCVYMCVISWI